MNEPNESYMYPSVVCTEGREESDENGWARRLSQEEIERLAFGAEHPDLVDPLIMSLPERAFSLKAEENLRCQMKEELGRAHEKRAVLLILATRGRRKLTEGVSEEPLQGEINVGLSSGEAA